MRDRDIYNALQDFDYVLDTQDPLNRQSVTELQLTARCHLRRAELMGKMAMFQEARAEYDEFKRHMKQAQCGISSKQAKVLKDIIRRTAESSKEPEKTALIRAVQVRLSCSHDTLFGL